MLPPSAHRRADRVDVLEDGRLAILDYKTGALPTGPDIAEGDAPQLPLEAAMAARGAFREVPAGSATAALLYWRLTGGPEPGEVSDAGRLLARLRGEADPAAAITAEAEAAWEHTRRLAARYLLGEAPFTARPHPARRPVAGDYDHLSRLAEWSGAEDAGGSAA